MEKVEFTKTSLHNHFGGRAADYKLNDTNSHTFDLNVAKQKLDSAAVSEFQLLAITNANHFWKNRYDDLLSYIKTRNHNIVLLPGVEFNIVDDITKNESDRKYLHLVFLVSPNSDLSQFENDIIGYRTENLTNAITIKNLVDLALKYKCILIPHGMKQNSSGRDSYTNSGTFDDILSIRDFMPIMIEDNTKSQRGLLEARIRQNLSDEKFE